MNKFSERSTDVSWKTTTLGQHLAVVNAVWYFVIMQNNESIDVLDTLKALASPVRLSILAALKTPLDFPEQIDGDRIKDGICADFIRERVALSAATVSRHLGLLAGAGLLIATRRKGWTFYRRDEAVIRSFVHILSREI